MGFIIDIENCLDCPYRQANVGGKVPHYCRLGRTCMSDADFPKYCPLSKKVELNTAKCDKWLDKIKQARDEIETETRVQVKHYTNTNAVIDEVLEVLDKLIEESEG